MSDQAWETPCPSRPSRDDRTHCVHWYEGGGCCSCGDDGGILDVPSGGTWA